MEAVSGSAWQGAVGARRQRIHAGLQRVGTLAAAFWHDACTLLATSEHFEVATHLVGHTLRELDGILLDLLLPAGFQPPPKGGARAAKAQAIAGQLDLGADVAGFWVSMKFDVVAHRRPPWPRPEDDDFRALVESYTDLLEILVGRFERRFNAWVGRLDEFLAIELPTDAHVKRLKIVVPWNEVSLGYFFDQLATPAWVIPLRDGHFFDHPAPVEYGEDTARFHSWPQGVYLQRVASDVGSEVADIVARLPASTNPHMTAAIAQVGAALPPEHYGSVHERLLDAVRNPFGLSLAWRDVIELVGHLTSVGDVDRAVELVRELLWLTGGATDAQPGADGEYRPLPQPVARLRPYDYQEAVRAAINALADARPRLAVISMLGDLLATANQHSTHDGAGAAPHDLSYIWRRMLDGDPSGPGEPRQALVGAIRDLSRRTAVDSPDEFDAVIDHLRSRDWLIFTRLALDAASQNASTQHGPAERLLMDRCLLDEYETEREYTQLLRVGFEALTPEQQDRLLGWIDEGPAEPWVTIDDSAEEEPTSDDRLDCLTDEWRLTRLWPIHTFLSPARQERFVALRDELGSTEPPEDRPQFVSWMGTQSPKDPNELAAMSIPELDEFLRTWTSTEDWRPGAPSKSGLGDALAQAIAQDPRHFAPFLTSSAADLDPTYVRAVVEGAASAVKAGRDVPWDRLLELLCSIVTNETADEAIPASPLVRDPGLLWTRSSIASLLEAAIRNGSSGLALGHRDRVFSIIEQLTADSDPTPARCSEAAANDPLLTIALNSIRGQGLRLVIDYLVWLHGQGVCESIDGSPEVLQLIDARLAEEPSPAVLSVLGRHFTTTVALDQEWAASLADRLFASRPSETDRHDPWCAYLAEGVTLRAFRTLEPFYERHVARLGESAEIGDCERNLVHHLLPVYWWGEIGEIDSGDEGLIGRLFATAPPALRAYAVEYAGLSLYRTEGVLDENVARRFRALWNWRRTSAESAVDRVAHASEAQAFEWWFTSDKLDEQWSLENLEWTLEVGPGPRHPHATALRLGVIARRSPAKLAPVLHCYELLIAAADENSQLLGWVEDLRDPLSWAITTGQDEAAASGRAIANMLVARGFLGFRDLAR